MKFRSTVSLAAIITLLSFSPALAYTAKDVANGGKLSGKVTFKGTAPAPKLFPIEKNPEVCGTGTREVKEVTVGAGGGLEHAVVYFQKVEAGKKWPAPEKNEYGTPKGYELNQKTCRFTPWLMVVPDKGVLSIVNRDPVLHNIHTYELIPSGVKFVRVTMFNEAQPTQGYTFNKKLRMRRGDSVKIECDAHNFMHSYLKVLKNPYYAISAADGSYSIDNIPPGKYKVSVWHSYLGKVNKDVEIGAGGSAELNHEFSE
jgi:hypothetical protein